MIPGKASRSTFVIAFCGAMVACAQLTPVGLRPIARSELCSSVPSIDLTPDLRSIRDRYVRGSDSAAAEVILEAIANQFACAPDAAVVVAFSYSGDGLPGATDGTACIGASVLERRLDRPRFEHWVACDRKASLDYLIDFNNIETENEPINPSLRLTGTVVPQSALALYFSQILDGRVTVTDYTEFLRDGVLYTIDEEDQLELAVGR